METKKKNQQKCITRVNETMNKREKNPTINKNGFFD